MLALCETVQCRRVQLLAYFGERATAVRQLRHLPRPAAVVGRHGGGAEAAVHGVRLQRERNQRFGAGQVIDILLGRKTEKVAQHDHDSLTVFGIGTELREPEWRGVVRQLLAQGLLAVEGDYGTLALTDASAAVLRGERQVMLRREAGAPGRGRAGAGATAAAAAELPGRGRRPLFERLRAWRAASRRSRACRRTSIFHDATLRQIAAVHRRPGRTGHVSGVGEAKLARYGQQILDTLGA